MTPQRYAPRCTWTNYGDPCVYVLDHDGPHRYADQDWSPTQVRGPSGRREYEVG